VNVATIAQVVILLTAILAAGCDASAPSSDPKPGVARPPGDTKPDASAPPAAGPAGEQRVAITASIRGFVPAEVKLTQGKSAVLELTRTDGTECVNAVKMPWMSKPIDLPQDETVRIPVDTSKAGTFTYSCWMNMVFGRVTIENP